MGKLGADAPQVPEETLLRFIRGCERALACLPVTQLFTAAVPAIRYHYESPRGQKTFEYLRRALVQRLPEAVVPLLIAPEIW